MELENQESQLENKEEIQPTIEDIAKEKGWKPKEEYEGEPSHWRSAEVFLALEEPLKRIEALGKELKNTKKTMQVLQEHHSKVKESEFNRALTYLKAQKKEAYEKGDVDAIIKIDDKIQEVKDTQAKQKEAEEVKENPMSDGEAVFVSWMQDNPWYETDEDLRDFADATGQIYHTKNPDKSPEDVLEYVANKVKNTFKDKFENKNRKKTSAVDGGDRNSNSRSTSSLDIELSDNERKVMNTLVRSGLMTKEEYMKDIKALRDKGL